MAYSSSKPLQTRKKKIKFNLTTRLDGVMSLFKNSGCIKQTLIQTQMMIISEPIIKQAFYLVSLMIL